MAISIERLREFLTLPPTSDTATALKAWRTQERLSQPEAAIRLGVSLRTLQGWELGRPMPYPSLLHRGVNIAARATAPYSLVQSDFPREFAEFLGFVGPDIIDSAVRKVEQKLGTLSAGARSLFGDRYFFHQQCNRFVDGSPPFQLDIADPVAVRAASLIAGINRVKRSLSSQGASRLCAMVKDNLMPDRDIRQIEHEIRCATHFARKGFTVTFADLEGLGNFDLLVETPSGSVDVECKTVTEETGGQIKTEMTVDLSERFRKTVLERPPADESGLFTMKLKRPAADCKNLGSQFEDALRSETARSFHTKDFSIEFSPRPQWQQLLESGSLVDLRRQILLDSDEYARCAIKVSGKIIGLIIHPHKPTVLSQRVVRVIKDGADQCTGGRPGVVWLHFVGLAETQFLAIAEFSKEGKGAGLNAIVANSLHPRASPTNRSHIQSIRFSADGLGIENHLSLAPNLLMVPSVSAGGPCYEVPNSLGRFPEISDL
ncbi:DNA-binding transcriptional regulator [Methylovirgula sp. HY1]|uniref:helix-turn-helix domain-containing protein n=1 Tax=Methylovirgula sp. HY1 TaxID=2822761 RepID=UPI001C5B18CE|nr:hypothetical protein [Methylovirgula sp. HY1]QXX76038.1 hypothetical protein MHY1_02873 [Methylovirgula sp. HY1]